MRPGHSARIRSVAASLSSRAKGEITTSSRESAPSRSLDAVRSAVISALDNDPLTVPSAITSSESSAPPPTSRASRSKNTTAAASSTYPRALSASSRALATARDTSTTAMRETGAESG